MVNGDDILNDMKVKIEEYKKQYDEVSVEIEKVGREYQAKIDDLQQERVRLLDEGNALLDKLKLKREQIRGMHASLFDQYSKYVKPEELENSNKDKQEVVEEKPAQEKPKPASKKKVEKQPTGLSDEEKETLAKITSKDVAPVTPNSTAKVDSKNNEIPEYLQDEYKK